MVLTFIKICWHLTEKWLSVHQGQKRHLTMTTFNYDDMSIISLGLK